MNILLSVISGNTELLVITQEIGINHFCPIHFDIYLFYTKVHSLSIVSQTLKISNLDKFGLKEKYNLPRPSMIKELRPSITIKTRINQKAYSVSGYQDILQINAYSYTKLSSNYLVNPGFLPQQLNQNFIPSSQ